MARTQTTANLIQVMSLLQSDNRALTAIKGMGVAISYIRLFVTILAISTSVLLSTVSLAESGDTSNILSLDVDGDGAIQPLTDGLLIVRYLFGFTGSTLVDGAIGGDAKYSQKDQILMRLNSLDGYLDVDGNGSTGALSDGLLIIRKLFGFRDNALIVGAISDKSSRKSAADVIAYLNTLESGIVQERALVHVPAPDLSNLAYGSATLYLLESFGFTSDESKMLVRATYLDDGDASPRLRYAMFLFDIGSLEYDFSINSSILDDAYGREIDVPEAKIVGQQGGYKILVKIAPKGEGEAYLVLLNGQNVLSANVVADLTGLPVEIDIEAFALSESARFVAIQTTSALLAPVTDPDTNDLSDIYIIDMNTKQSLRATFLAGTEVYDACFLADLHVDGANLELAFVSAAVFVNPRIDQNSVDSTGSELERSDLLLSRIGYTDQGFTADVAFSLISQNADEVASGLIDRFDPVTVTSSGVFFSSTANGLADTDYNNLKDGFRSLNNSNIRLLEAEVGPLAADTTMMGASRDGKYYALLTPSEKLGTEGFQQVVYVNAASGDWQLVSANPLPANGWVINGKISDSGGRVAFTTDATNLSSEPPVTISGDLFLKVFF